jgi:ribose-phosphate pyrophosphokinase
MAMDRLAKSPIKQIVATNTIPNGDRIAPIRDKFVELCVSKLLGEAIHRIHHNQSVSALFARTAGAKR